MPPSDKEILRIFGEMDPQDFPVGVYVVRPDGYFLIASPPVRRLLQLPPSGPVNQISIATLYANPGDRAALLQQAQEEAQRGWHLEGAMAHFRINGEDVFAQLHCKPLTHPQSGEVIAYYGCLIDSTAEMQGKQREQALKERVEELTIDIGRVLHANTTTLLMVDHTLKPVQDLLTLEAGLAQDEIRLLSEQELPLLERNVQRLVKAIDQLLESGDEERRNQALHPLRWDYLRQVRLSLSEYQTVAGVPEAYPSYLRGTAREVAALADEIKPGSLPRKLTRQIHRQALDVQRLATLVTAHRTLTAVSQMDYTIRALREYITSDVRAEEKQAVVSVNGLVDQVVAELSEFARTSGVEIVKKDFCPQAKIQGREREFMRTFANVLHNAIKYSWSLSHSKPPWVTIETKCHEGRVEVSFENRGVPIASEEIEQGLIFELGYRGRLSRDRNRLGTGIGLTDALRVARQHGGSVTISSRPASTKPLARDDPAYYEQPFLTVVVISLPLA